MVCSFPMQQKKSHPGMVASKRPPRVLICCCHSLEDQVEAQNPCHGGTLATVEGQIPLHQSLCGLSQFRLPPSHLAAGLVLPICERVRRSGVKHKQNPHEQILHLGIRFLFQGVTFLLSNCRWWTTSPFDTRSCLVGLFRLSSTCWCSECRLWFFLGVIPFLASLVPASSWEPS